MKRSDRMQSIARIAESDEKDAAKDMEQCSQQYQKQEAYLAELMQYQKEYTERMNRALTDGLNKTQFHQYRMFLDNLTQAVNQQKRIVEEAKTYMEQTRADWLKRYNRTRALEKAVDLYKRDENFHDEKQQQKFQDEMASRNHGKGNSVNGNNANDQDNNDQDGNDHNGA